MTKEKEQMIVQCGHKVTATPDRERGTSYAGLNQFARKVGKDEATAWWQKTKDRKNK